MHKEENYSTIYLKYIDTKEAKQLKNLFSGKLKYTAVFLCALLLFTFFIPQAVAAEVFQVKSSFDLCVSEDNWWDRGVQYGRLLRLSEKAGQENVLLATHCVLNAGLSASAPGYPIYRSSDGGYNWEKISFVTDRVTGLNSEWNPVLYELHSPCGKYPSGTVVLGGVSVDPEHKKESRIRLYFSTDGGYTFDEGVDAASGGGLDEGVWEPFIIQLTDGRLVCFYSDDTDPEHSQKIVYRISADGENWEEAVSVVASDITEERPGMPVVTRLGDGSYFMVYEIVDKDGTQGNPVYCRRSEDGLDWGDAAHMGEEVISRNGKKALGSAPFCGWTPAGGENGTLIVSGTFMRKGESDTGTALFISRDCGKTWNTVPHIIPYTAAEHVGYSNSFSFSEDGKTIYAINNPQSPENPEKSKMVIAVAEINETDKAASDKIFAFSGIAAIVVVSLTAITLIRRRRRA